MLIPEVRGELLGIARELRDLSQPCYRRATARRLEALEKELYRRVPVRKAAPKRSGVSYHEIREYADAHPDALYIEIGEALHVNTSSVSEALAGLRR